MDVYMKTRTNVTMMSEMHGFGEWEVLCFRADTDAFFTIEYIPICFVSEILLLSSDDIPTPDM